eukprot:768676-Hanusia_phi.AAC.2
MMMTMSLREEMRNKKKESRLEHKELTRQSRQIYQENLKNLCKKASAQADREFFVMTRMFDWAGAENRKIFEFSSGEQELNQLNAIQARDDAQVPCLDVDNEMKEGIQKGDELANELAKKVSRLRASFGGMICGFEHAGLERAVSGRSQRPREENEWKTVPVARRSQHVERYTFQIDEVVLHLEHRAAAYVANDAVVWRAED